MQEQSVNIKDLMQSLAQGTQSFLQSEVEVTVTGVDCRYEPVSTLELSYLTSLISVNSCINMFFAFSFEKDLIFFILRQMTQDLDYPKDEEAEYLESAATEMLNIVVGNAAAFFSRGGGRVSFSPPIVIKEAKSIIRTQGTTFYSSVVKTRHGSLYIHLIGPRQLFDEQLNYLEAGACQSCPSW